MSTFVNFNIIDEKFFLWLFFEIHRISFIFRLEWNIAFIFFNVLIVFFFHFSFWLRILITRILYIITTLIWRFKFALSQRFIVYTSSFFNIFRDFSLLILSTMLSSEWHRAVNMFFRDFCFVSMSRIFLTIFFEVIFYVIWIFFCSIILIAIFSSLFEESIDVFFASTSNLIIAISRRAIVAQILLFFLYNFFFCYLFQSFYYFFQFLDFLYRLEHRRDVVRTRDARRLDQLIENTHHLYCFKLIESCY